jgi:uncharacterized protein YjbI with pentapeptide repeats
MSTLLLEKDLRNSEEGSEVRTLARARTLTALSRLDPSRRASIVRFLDEAYLMQSKANLPSGVGRNPFRGIFQQDRNRNLGDAPVIRLSQAQLNHTNMTGADLGGADLRKADLRKADLSNADLTETSLSGTDLSGTDLAGAYLDGAYLGGANLSEADLSGTNLIQADLSGANLSGANLSGANLRETYLVETNLSDTDLSGANLRDARGVTDKQLLQAKTLEGATMPDGSIHD